jgi:hypothetical protein
MHFHLPKPLHGWREFAGEVGIIVIGVGIALAAEQALEANHWRHVVHAEGEAVEQEVSDNEGAMMVRVLMQPCVDRRLNELAEVFRRHDASKPLGLIAPIGRVTIFTGSKSTLEMAIADQSVSHMPLARKQAIFATYGTYEIFTTTAQEERAGWRKLQALDHADSLEAADWRDLRQAYDGIVDNNVTMEANLKAGKGSWLVPYDTFPQPDRADLVRRLKSLPYVQKLCRPAMLRASA